MPEPPNEKLDEARRGIEADFLINEIQTNPALEQFRRSDRPSQRSFIHSQLSQSAGRAFTGLTPEKQQLLVTQTLIEAAPPLDTGEQAQVSLEDKAPIPFGMAGTVLGAQLGAAAGPLGAVGGAAVGGALGAAAGVAFPETTREFLAPNLPPRFDTKGLVEAMAIEGGISGIFHGAGESIASLASKAFGSLRKRAILGSADEPIESAAARQAIESRGGTLTPTQLRSDEELPSLTSFLENISRFAMFARGSFKQLDAKNVSAVNAFADDFSLELASAMSPRQLSASLVNGLANGQALAAPIAKSLWSEVDTLARGVTPDVTQTFINVGKLQRLPAFKKLSDGLVLLDHAGQPLTIQRILHKPTFASVNDLRSQLLGFRRANKRSTDSTVLAARKIAGDLQGQLFTSLDKSIAAVGPHARQAYNKARSFTKNTAGQFNDRAVLNLARKAEEAPDALVEQMIKAGPKGLEALDAIRKLESGLNTAAKAGGRRSPKLFEKVQQSIAKEVLTRAQLKSPLTGETTRIDGNKLLAVFQGKGSLTENFFNEAFPSSIQKALPKLANAIEVAARRPQGPGRVAIQLVQIGAASTIAGSSLALLSPGSEGQNIGLGAATVIMLGPRAAAKLFTNPRAMRNLSQGILGGPKSTAFRRAITQIAATERKSVGLELEEKGIAKTLGFGASPVTEGLDSTAQPQTQDGSTTLSTAPSRR